MPSLAPSLAPSLLALLACPALRSLRPCHRAAWAAFLGALFGVALDAQSARRARRALRELEALGAFVLGAAELWRAAEQARQKRPGRWPSRALAEIARGTHGTLGELPWGSLVGLDPRAAGAWGAFWRGSPASVVQDLDPETARDARAFRAFVRRARRIARELEHGATGASLSAANDTTAHVEGARS